MKGNKEKRRFSIVLCKSFDIQANMKCGKKGKIKEEKKIFLKVSLVQCVNVNRDMLHAVELKATNELSLSVLSFSLSLFISRNIHENWFETDKTENRKEKERLRKTVEKRGPSKPNHTMLTKLTWTKEYTRKLNQAFDYKCFRCSELLWAVGIGLDWIGCWCWCGFTILPMLCFFKWIECDKNK